MDNCELFSNIITDIIDFYIFYSKNYTYVYRNLITEKKIYLYF